MQLLDLLALAALATAVALPEKRDAARTAASSSMLAAAVAAFTSARIVPDVVPSSNPDVAVKVNYNGKQVNLGNTFSAAETLNEPMTTFTVEPNYDPATTKYKITLVDSDAPGPGNPVLRNYLPLIVSDAQPKCIATEVRKTVATYAQTTPLSVATHRYTLLVYRQPPNHVPPPDLHHLSADRSLFSVTEYVAKAGLMGPVGGNFFKEGLGSTVCAVAPGCTQDGTGYAAP